MGTIDNLKEAFAGESQANRRYLAFAKKADADGFSQVAKLFRAAADAETVHALKHLDVMDGVQSTEENLRTAVAGEDFEHETMYPGFISEARAEGNEAAAKSFWRANDVEKIHAGLYRKALDELGQNPDADYYVCQVCGNTVENEAPEFCPICGAKRSRFNLIG